MEAGDIEGGNRNKARSLDMGMDVDEDIEMAGHIGEGHHSGRVIGDSHEGGKRGVIDRRYSYSSDTSKISDDELLPSSAAADTNNRHHSDGHSVHLVDGSVVNSSNSRSNIVSTSSTMKIRNPLQRQSAQYSSVPGIEHSGKVVHVANNNNSSTRSDHMQFGEERKEGDRDVEDGDDRDDDDDEPWRRLSSESESALAAAIRGDASDRTNTNTNGNDTDGHTLSAAAPRWTHVDLVSSHGQHSEDQGTPCPLPPALSDGDEIIATYADNLGYFTFFCTFELRLNILVTTAFTPYVPMMMRHLYCRHSNTFFLMLI
jgi:hypothetical protein